MARAKKDLGEDFTIADAMEYLQGKFGVKALQWGKDITERERVSTGIPELDEMLGGGFVPGRVYEFFGEKNSGKTTLAMRIAKSFPQVAWVNANKAFSRTRYEQLGGDMEKMIMVNDSILSHVGEDMLVLAQAGIPLIVVDTLASLIPDKVMEEGGKGMGEVSAIAPLAAFFSQKGSLILDACYKSGTILLFLNRVSQLINLRNPYAFPYGSPGGHHIKALYAARVAMGKGAKVEITVKGDKHVIGYYSALSLFDSNISEPTGRVELPLIRGHGIVSFAELAGVKEQVSLAIKERLLLAERTGESGEA